MMRATGDTMILSPPLIWTRETIDLAVRPHPEGARPGLGRSQRKVIARAARCHHRLRYARPDPERPFGKPRGAPALRGLPTSATSSQARYPLKPRSTIASSCARHRRAYLFPVRHSRGSVFAGLGDSNVTDSTMQSDPCCVRLRSLDHKRCHRRNIFAERRQEMGGYRQPRRLGRGEDRGTVL